eukprot:6491861-Alexandrium_andersonii.AAC.1
MPVIRIAGHPGGIGPWSALDDAGHSPSGRPFASLLILPPFLRARPEVQILVAVTPRACARAA